MPLPYRRGISAPGDSRLRLDGGKSKLERLPLYHSFDTHERMVTVESYQSELW